MKVSNNTPPSTQMVEQSKSAERSQAGERAEAKATGDKNIDGNSMVRISDDAKLMQKATEMAHSAPDVRADRVAALRAQIDSGTYHIDAGAIADRLLTEHLGTDFGQNNL